MNTKSMRLADVAEVIRSKYTGLFEVTIDILFGSSEASTVERHSKAISPAAVAEHFRIPREQVLDVLFYDPAWAVRISLLRPVCSSTMGDRDVYSAQKYAPLLELELN